MAATEQAMKELTNGAASASVEGDGEAAPPAAPDATGGEPDATSDEGAEPDPGEAEVDGAWESLLADEPGEESEAAAPEAKAPPASDPRDEEIAQLRRREAELLGLLGESVKRPVQPATPARAPVSKVALRMLFMGAPKEQWEQIPAEQRQAAQATYEQYVDRVTEEMTDPEAGVRRILGGLDERIEERIRPIVRETYVQRAERAAATHFGKLSEAERPRAHELFWQEPGARSGDWAHVEAAMSAAAAKARLEGLEKAAAERAAEKEARGRQGAVSGGRGLRGTPTNGGKPSATPAGRRQPGESWNDYYARVLKTTKSWGR